MNRAAESIRIGAEHYPIEPPPGLDTQAQALFSRAKNQINTFMSLNGTGIAYIARHQKPEYKLFTIGKALRDISQHPLVLYFLRYGNLPIHKDGTKPIFTMQHNGFFSQYNDGVVELPYQFARRAKIDPFVAMQTIHLLYNDFTNTPPINLKHYHAGVGINPDPSLREDFYLTPFTDRISLITDVLAATDSRLVVYKFFCLINDSDLTLYQSMHPNTLPQGGKTLFDETFRALSRESAQVPPDPNV